MSAALPYAASGDDVRSRQQFVSDVFHTLSQPLTALRCSIELALMQEGTAQSYRAALEDALSHAERVTSCAEFARVMAEADDPGIGCETDLSACVAAVVDEFVPMFEATGHVIHASTDASAHLFVDPEKLARALFLLLDFCAAEQADVALQVQPPGRLEIAYTGAGPSAGERARQSLDLAKRMFAASGAQLRTSYDQHQQRIAIAWPANAGHHHRLNHEITLTL